MSNHTGVHDDCDDCDEILEERLASGDFVPAVTEAMIDRAGRAFFMEYEKHDGHGWEWRKSIYGDSDPARAKLRAALEAALYESDSETEG